MNQSWQGTVFSTMADAASILNPNNPLLDSEEEDDDFEPGNKDDSDWTDI